MCLQLRRVLSTDGLDDSEEFTTKSTVDSQAKLYTIDFQNHDGPTVAKQLFLTPDQHLNLVQVLQMLKDPKLGDWFFVYRKIILGDYDGFEKIPTGHWLQIFWILDFLQVGSIHLVSLLQRYPAAYLVAVVCHCDCPEFFNMVSRVETTVFPELLPTAFVSALWPKACKAKTLANHHQSITYASCFEEGWIVYSRELCQDPRNEHFCKCVVDKWCKCEETATRILTAIGNKRYFM